jgi:hypothetical protein
VEEAAQLFGLAGLAGVLVGVAAVAAREVDRGDLARHMGRGGGDGGDAAHRHAHQHGAARVDVGLAGQGFAHREDLRGRRRQRGAEARLVAGETLSSGSPASASSP